MFVLPDTGTLLLTGFIISLMALNLIAYLISSFYRRKFNQPSPRNGFLAGTVLLLLYNLSLFTARPSLPAVAVAKVLLVYSGSIVSTASAVALYYTMKKVRK
jgi:hypothetical protein